GSLDKTFRVAGGLRRGQGRYEASRRRTSTIKSPFKQSIIRNIHEFATYPIKATISCSSGKRLSLFSAREC
ncbi:hypothetical protein, partial [Thermogutta sp.]|uniref:hypothetical protein n=1 Tax=Thermogutta sp. TaxID=1962930 RepID=UPI0025E6D927